MAPPTKPSSGPEAQVIKGDPRKTDAASFRLLVESVVDYAIFMLDPNGVVTTWNAGAERIKGYRAEEIIGQHFSRFYPAEVVAQGTCDWELVVAAREGRFEDEGWRLRKNGSRFWASVVITALHDETGKLVGFAKVTRDLTERRAAEEAQRLLAAEQAAHRVKDEFLATVSHELRNPLNSILGWAVLLKEKLTEPSARKILDTIVRNAESQSRLIDDLLDVGRIVAGKLSIEPEPTDLVVIAREAIDIMQPLANAKRLELSFDTKLNAAPCHGDPRRLLQILINILTNAVKFTDAGTIKVILAKEGDTLRLSVRDTGRGIEPDFLPYVFERFRQSESVKEQRTGGLGLGLAIVRHLVKLHGGEVSAESEGLGTGTTIRLALPTGPKRDA